jgi:hypothetical protein
MRTYSLLTSGCELGWKKLARNGSFVLYVSTSKHSGIRCVPIRALKNSCAGSDCHSKKPFSEVRTTVEVWGSSPHGPTIVFNP